ncbi:hypothetical protein SAMN04489733_3631 [Amycolatopsis keratiniphila]|nr:hypothetical protein SAMN04489733_3631 [Amycolatopsis keratiniphila]
MHLDPDDQEAQLDLWADEPAVGMAASACCASSGSSISTVSTPASTSGTAGSAGSTC